MQTCSVDVTPPGVYASRCGSLQMVGIADNRAAARVVGANANVLNFQAKGPRNNGVSRLVVCGGAETAFHFGLGGDVAFGTATQSSAGAAGAFAARRNPTSASVISLTAQANFAPDN